MTESVKQWVYLTCQREQSRYSQNCWYSDLTSVGIFFWRKYFDFILLH